VTDGVHILFHFNIVLLIKRDVHYQDKTRYNKWYNPQYNHYWALSLKYKIVYNIIKMSTNMRCTLCLWMCFSPVVNTSYVILYVSVLPQIACRLLLADRNHDIFHLPWTVDVSKLRTHTVWYMSCFKHCMSSRLTNSVTGLVIFTNIEMCGKEKHFICHSSNGYLSESSEVREMDFAQKVHNMYCLLKLSYLEHSLCSINS
jgi:hypothetical protein